MKKGWFFLVVLYFSVLPLAGGAEDKTAVRKDRYPVCGMFVSQFARWNATIEFADATQATFDGTKCMFKYYLDIEKYNPLKSTIKISAISVKDYYTQKAIPARKAYFVIWSDVYGPMGHEPLPFEREAEARKFLREHKGRKILRFGDITQGLLQSLDNP